MIAMTEDVLKTSIRRGAEQRLEFIEFRAFWEGTVNRSDIIEQFGVSVPQASNDLSLYRERAPDNLEYDSSAKCYVRAANFRPSFLQPNADRYLAQLRAADAGIISLSDTWIGSAPVVDAMPVPFRKVDPDFLQQLLEVIRSKRSIDIHYQSMSKDRPDPMWRRVTPHALGFDDARCHIRAYCHVRDEFNDFVLSRISGLRKPSEAGADVQSDTEWNTYFDLVLEPNPALSVGQRKVIATEYAMRGGKTHMRVRYALLHYVNRRLRLDEPPADNPAATPVIAANRLELMQILNSMKTRKPRTREQMA
jgi:hypothetical protein